MEFKFHLLFDGKHLKEIAESERDFQYTIVSLVVKMIVIDTREIALISEWKEKYPSIPISIKPLDIGDIQFFDASENRIAIVERKTNSDLVASLKDGRWKEQKSRILPHCNEIPIVYIFEGKLMNDEKLISCCLGSQIRDGLCVIQSMSITHTATIIHKLWTKLSTKEWQKLQASSSSVEHPTRAMKKSENHTDIEIWKSQLACIPRVSLTTARKIVEVFPSLQTLQNSATIDSLKNIQISEKRKLGIKLAETILAYFTPKVELTE